MHSQIGLSIGREIYLPKLDTRSSLSVDDKIRVTVIICNVENK